MSNQPYPYDPAGSEPQQYPPTQYTPIHQVAPKNPAIALLVSFFIPGVGSMMNGDVGKGIGILAGYVVSMFLTLIIIGLFGVIGFWIWGMVDAYNGARKWNLRHGILS